MPKKQRKPTETNFCSYLHKINKTVNTDLHVTKGAIAAANAVLDALTEKLTNKSADVARLAKKSTLSARHVQAAAKIALPCALSKFAILEGTKALTKYSA